MIYAKLHGFTIKDPDCVMDLLEMANNVCKFDNRYCFPFAIGSSVTRSGACTQCLTMNHSVAPVALESRWRTLVPT
ncbi:MAG TPA: hypothetical protein VKM55_10190 [Candidatus Lokiarchaeia archaeon]|nr:hypothetical protein [Candidatus Lokiarchaeia archaeon]